MLKYVFMKMVSLVNVYRRFCRPKDYTIEKVTLVYTQKKKPYKKRPGIWDREQYYWTPEGSTHYVDYTWYYQNGSWVPDDTLFRVKYWYQGRLYTFVTRDQKHTWPPNQSKEMKFTLPIVNAVIIKDDGTVISVNDQIKKTAGPFHNFFNQRLTPYDIIDTYDFNTLVLVNVLNSVFKFHKDEIIQLP